MTTRPDERESSKRRGPRARSSRETKSEDRKATQRITPRGESAAAGRHPKIEDEEPQQAEVMRAPAGRTRSGDLLRDVMFDLLAPHGDAPRFSLALDLRETADALIVEAELPGLSPEDVNVTVHGDVLTIAGEKRWRDVRDDEVVHVIERGEGRFVRSFRLPEPVGEDAVEATFDDGVLTVRIAKPRGGSARTIQVRSPLEGRGPGKGP